MDLQHLRTFRSVVSTGSVRSAADALGCSPSSVSQQVSALQRETGLTLMTRVGRGVEPTAAGRAFADRIDPLLAEVNGLDSFVRGLREGNCTTFVLGYTPSLSTVWLPLMLKPLSDAYPDAQIQMFVANAFDPHHRPRPDVQFVVHGPEDRTPAGYRSFEIATDPYVVALPLDHPATAQQQVNLADLATEDWIDNETSPGWCRQVVLEACAAAGFQPRFPLQTHDYPTALALVAAGLGITVLPSMGAHTLPPQVEVRPVVGPVPVRTISALVLDETADSPLSITTLELARRAAGTGSSTGTSPLG